MTTSGRTWLMLACAKGVAVIERGLVFDCILRSIPTADPQGDTALHYLLRTNPAKRATANKAALLRVITLLVRHGAVADVAAVDINSLHHFQTYMQMYPETVLLLISLGAQYRYCHDQTPACVCITRKGPRAKSQVRFRGKQCLLFAREAAWFRRKAFAAVHHQCQGQCLLADTDQQALVVSLAVSGMVFGKLDLARRIAAYI
jgi:hypothetical protein